MAGTINQAVADHNGDPNNREQFFQEEGLSETGVPPNEEVSNGSCSERFPQNILSEKGRLGKYIWCWKKIGGFSFIGYGIYCKFY
jgi:hypothetical protein